MRDAARRYAEAGRENKEDRYVLVVDDDSLVAYPLSTYLEREGLDVTVVTSSGEALSLIENVKFDIVITGLGMASVSGIEIIRRLRRLEFDGKVVVMSAHHGAFEKELSELKVDRLVVKPFKMSEILRLISL